MAKRIYKPVIQSIEDQIKSARCTLVQNEDAERMAEKALLIAASSSEEYPRHNETVAYAQQHLLKCRTWTKLARANLAALEG